MPADIPYRPPLTAPRPLIRGPQTAMVTGPAGEEIWTDKYGRVKVQFHWDREGKRDEKSSCWVRVSQAWAGPGFGGIHVPRIGQEVIVEFLEGDPDRPLVTGRVYNAQAMPPYGLPASATQSGIKSNSTKGGGGSNELRFEDKKGQEQVWLHAQKNEDIVVENDKTENVGHDETIGIGNDRTETVGHDETMTVANNRTRNVGVNETVTIGGNQHRHGSDRRGPHRRRRPAADRGGRAQRHRRCRPGARDRAAATAGTIGVNRTANDRQATTASTSAATAAPTSATTTSLTSARTARPRSARTTR